LSNKNENATVPKYEFFSELNKARKNSDFGTVAFSFLFDKYYPIMDLLGSKDSSRDLQTNCAISFYFRLYLMLHACALRFDVTENLEKFLVWQPQLPVLLGGLLDATAAGLDRSR